MDVDRQDEGESAPCVFDSSWPSSQFVFELVSRDCHSHSHFSCLSLFLHHSTSLFYSTISLYPAHSIAAVLCARHRAAWHCLRASVEPGCHPSLLLSSFLPLSLLTLATESRVLVHSCSFFDTFSPAPKLAAEEWGLEVKQVWLIS